MRSLLDEIKYISDNFGPRIAGSEADGKTIKYLEQRFHSFSKDVSTESFPVVGRSLQYLIIFLVYGYFFSVIAYVFLAPLSLGLAITMLIVYYLARFQDKNLVNLLVKKTETSNVIAKFEPKGEKKLTIIFSGHHDSAFHMPLFEKKLKQIVLIQNGALLGIVMLVIASIWKTIFMITDVVGFLEIVRYNIGSLQVVWLLLPDLFFLLAFIGLFLGFYFLANMVTKTPLIGANDNLTSVVILLGLGEYLKKNPPNNLEVYLVSFGAEEPGLNGSKFFVDKRKNELVGSININFETVGSGQLGVIEIEKDNNVVHDSKLVKFIQDVGEKNGYKLPAMKIHYGNTDAGSFSKRKLVATTIFGYGKNDVFDLWHSTEDIPDNLNSKILEDAFNLTIHVLKEFEKIEEDWF
ncbi:MAG: M20/M25/M40 family metallo-hydrolase [Candidatus Heimdallarchaeota archaeon]|nr:M20/M25/M40 family metallo-hydrolase [Candidatus Heimdallarchaeota archaeon]